MQPSKTRCQDEGRACLIRWEPCLNGARIPLMAPSPADANPKADAPFPAKPLDTKSGGGGRGKRGDEVFGRKARTYIPPRYLADPNSRVALRNHEATSLNENKHG